jgi:alpha-glucosidase
MQMFGITYSGADVCGFNGVATEEMCTRWMELGAFYPFARNHNVIGSAGQEPYVWNSTAEASRIALGARYEMLPYFYTLFEESNRVGTGVWRPLIFEYPDYQSFTDNDVQFLIGSDILISPVVDEGATSVDAQFPAGTWYDWYSHEITTGSSNKHKKETVKLDAPLTHIPIHIRGGSIIPTKTAKYTVDETYATDYNIIIALDKFSQAEGRLYIDDGESLQVKKSSSIDFTFKHNKLSASGKFDYKDAENLSKITILGEHATKLTSAKIGNKSYKLEKSGKNTVTVSGFSTKLSGSFSIQFS